MRILICEDSTLLREGLVRVLEDAGHTVVAALPHADALVDTVTETAQADSIDLGAGNDRLYVAFGAANVKLDLGADTDWVRYGGDDKAEEVDASSTTTNLSLARSVAGGPVQTELVGNVESFEMSMYGGNDTADASGITAASTVDKSLKTSLKTTANIEAAKAVGKLIAERAVAKGVKEVAFDRSGYKYHGRVKALADAAREGGLQF